MLLAAIAAAVLVAVAIGILKVAISGAGLIVLGAFAGLVGGAIGRNRRRTVMQTEDGRGQNLRK